MNILGLTKTTLLDYPEHVAATIFMGGCNFRCPFCHNRDIVFQDNNIEAIDVEEIIRFLIKRKNILSGVCITGGEPTLNNDLGEFVRRIKDIGYKVKLDTNGSNPEVLRGLIDEGLIDYCAMDIKNSREKYAVTCGVAGFDIESVEESIDILLHQDKIDYEFRTTVVRELHSMEDMVDIAKWIQGARRYYIQSYKDCEQVICRGYSAYGNEVLEAMVEACREYVGDVRLRAS
jgi:pyruvate formate lyase activating enzyme